MKKKMLFTTLALGATAVVGLTGCGKETFKVTFDADPLKTEDNIVVEYKEGEKSLSSIPTVIEKDGFAGVWEDFSLNDTNFTVNAKYGDGTQANPYMVAKASQLKKILTDYTYSKENVETANKTYFKFIADIDLNDIEDLQSLEISNKYLKAEIDGDGHKLLNLDGTKLNSTEGALFHNVVDSTIKNLNVYLGSTLGALVNTARDGNVVLENIKVYNAENITSTFITSDDTNESAFIYFAKGENTTLKLKNCENYANYVSTAAYNGIFLGGYTGNQTALIASLSFENCFNYGNVVSAGSVGVLTGNGFLAPIQLNVTNCKNFGIITTKENDGSFLVAKANGSYGVWAKNMPSSEVSYIDYYNTSANGYVNSGNDATFKKLDSKYTATINGNNINVTATEGNISAGKYQLILSAAYATTSTGATLFTNIVLEENINEGDSLSFRNGNFGMIDLNSFNEVTGFGVVSSYTPGYMPDGYNWTELEGYNIRYAFNEEAGYYIVDFSQYEKEMGLEEGEKYVLHKTANQVKKVIVAYAEDNIDFVVDFN